MHGIPFHFHWHFVGIYHGSLTEHSRSVHQDRFSDGRERIIASTSAFGMGVDVSNISLVICFGCPSNGLEFVQQIVLGGIQADVPCRCHLIWKGSEQIGSKHVEWKFLLKKVDSSRCTRVS